MTLRAFARLTALLFLVGLLASRVGVVVHELLGHYGVARFYGCSLAELRLFLFGGGWVDYSCGALAPGERLATDLGGIAVQVGAGALLAAVAWGRAAAPLWRLALASTAALFVLHGLFYLVTGLHYGVGDGRELHLLLADQRGTLAIAGSVLLVTLCFVAAAWLATVLAPWLPPGADRWRRPALASAAILVAGALHGAAFRIEQRILADVDYAEMSRPQPQIEVERELRRFEVARRPSPEQVAAQRRMLEAQHAVFPLRPVLAAGMAAAVLLGLFRTLGPGDAAPAPRRVGGVLAAAAICAVAEAIVVVLDRWL